MVRVRQHRRRVEGGTTSVVEHERKEKLSMAQLQSELRPFSGSEDHFRHMSGLIYTDGINYLAERAEAFWLIDLIASYHRKEPFQIWILKVDKSKAMTERSPWAVITMQEDTNAPIIVKQNIPYTDFPNGTLKLYVSNGTLMLPNEY